MPRNHQPPVRSTLALAVFLALPFGIKDCRSDREMPGAEDAAAVESQSAKSQSAESQSAKSQPAVQPSTEKQPAVEESATSTELQSQIAELRKTNTSLRTAAGKLVPKDPFIVINTTLNRLEMRKGDDVLVNAVVSTGSNTELVEPNGKRRWFFSTPKGVHTVKNKMIAPTWVKPDWAFIEEGEPVPGPQAEARFEEGTLGKYGLYFGNGYLIHGTLFQRFLGQSVTHGCVRVGDQDLEKVYQNAKIGTKIYIY